MQLPSFNANKMTLIQNLMMDHDGVVQLQVDHRVRQLGVCPAIPWQVCLSFTEAGVSGPERRPNIEGSTRDRCKIDAYPWHAVCMVDDCTIKTQCRHITAAA